MQFNSKKCHILIITKQRLEQTTIYNEDTESHHGSTSLLTSAQLFYLTFNGTVTLTDCLSLANTRGHAYNLYLHDGRINIRKHSFSERVVAPENNSPAMNEHVCSLSSFERLVNSTDLSMCVLLGF